jgi:hypothetical protein
MRSQVSPAFLLTGWRRASWGRLYLHFSISLSGSNGIEKPKHRQPDPPLLLVNLMYKAPTAMWEVIQVKGNGNIKDTCDALAWDMIESGLQVWWKEHQSAKSSAQVLLMNVPEVLEQGGVENEILWHQSEIERKLPKRGTLPLEYVGIPLPDIKVLLRQSKQGK